jgi:hypothetical protein
MAKAAVGLEDPVDISGPGIQDVSGEFVQPFWDQRAKNDQEAEIAREERDDPNELSSGDIGITGGVFADNPWDRLQLGDYVLPGLWRVSGSVAIQLDVQKPQGFDGAALITRGYIPGRFSFEGMLWTQAQWARWQEIAPALWTRPHKRSPQDVPGGPANGAVYFSAQTVVLGKNQTVKTVNRDEGLIVGKQKSLTVVHPALNSAPYGISAVVIERLYIPHDGQMPLTKTIQMDCVEYVPEPQQMKSAQKKTIGQKTRGQGAFEKAITSRKVAEGRPSHDPAALGPGELPKT